MYPADQPGYSTPSPISVPDEIKSVTNTSHRVSSSPNVTSSSVVQPGEPQPDDEPPVPVLNEKSQPEHLPTPTNLVSVFRAKRPLVPHVTGLIGGSLATTAQI